MGGSGEGLKMLKGGKVPVSDGILNEMLIYGKSRMVESMRYMFNLMWRSQVYPQEWKSIVLSYSGKCGNTV